MSIFESYNSLGKNNMKATRSDFINMMGEDGVRNIVKKIFLGGNVRDVTEFITQRRLMNSYAAMLDLYIQNMGQYAENTNDFVKYVTEDLKRGKGDTQVLDLWLLGLTKKGLDNIVRTEENIVDYQYSFTDSINDTVKNLENTYGKLSGVIEIDNKKMALDWKIISLLGMAMGAQTLTIRGSAKSMNGKMFEKLILGSLLTIMGFEYQEAPPDIIDENKKIFWLSNMDQNEREIDGTLVYKGKAISIDIGFIGKGNPEITLDKVTRFNAYKQIGGLPHDMTTIIIVDTVGENSDLFHKADRVNGHVLQMKKRDWTIEFSKTVSSIMGISHELSEKSVDELEQYYDVKLSNIDIRKFMK